MRIGAALAVLALGLLTGACSATAPDPGPDPAPDTADGPSGKLTVFAAASLKAAFDELIEGFRAEYPGVAFAPTVYDGSSVLVTQLESGAHADVFSSADEATMAKAAQAGLLAGSPELFASNELVIAVAPGNPLGIETLSDLAATGASGQPPLTVMCAEEVPCGTAARVLLDGAGVVLTPASQEQNVSAVLSKVVAGEADAGLVYRTDVQIAAGEVEGVEIEDADEHPNLYPIAVLRQSQAPEAAQAFVDFVRAERGQRILAAFGFGTP